jgi:hypothetical protein
VKEAWLFAAGIVELERSVTMRSSPRSFSLLLLDELSGIEVHYCPPFNRFGIPCAT